MGFSKSAVATSDADILHSYFSLLMSFNSTRRGLWNLALLSNQNYVLVRMMKDTDDIRL